MSMPEGSTMGNSKARDLFDRISMSRVQPNSANPPKAARKVQQNRKDILDETSSQLLDYSRDRDFPTYRINGLFDTHNSLITEANARWHG